jgi:hypothetical protein
VDRGLSYTLPLMVDLLIGLRPSTGFVDRRLSYTLLLMVELLIGLRTSSQYSRVPLPWGAEYFLAQANPAKMRSTRGI